MKVKNSIYNIFFGILGQVITISLGLIIPRMFLLNLGSEANGLMSSISQIFIYIGLLEAGIGSVSIQALYKPIANNDKNAINKIMAATEKYYLKAGFYYLICIGLLGIIYPIVIKSKFNKFEVFLVILFTGLSGAINFLFQGKFKVLLTAEGKNYVITNITTVLGVISSLVKVILIYLGFNIVVIQFSYFILGVLQMIFFEIYMKKNYKWINTKVDPDYKAIEQKGSAFIHQISAMIFANTDVLIITIFCGLKVASVYSLYNLIITYISEFIWSINSGVVFVLGQKYYENREEYIKLNEVYDTYYMAITFSIYTIAYILILPFMNLYTKGVADINYVDNILPILFISVQLLSCARTAANNAINVAGHFKNTKNRSILEAAINIIVSLICVNIFGVYGVLIGTIVALLYRVNDIILYSHKHILFKSPKKTYLRWGINLLLMISIINTTSKFNINISTYIEFIYIGMILCAIVLPIFLISSSIFNKECFYIIKDYIKLKFKKRILRCNRND
ncbi:MATE family efflux transporter [Clostridium perfringens]|uniref:sugar isomerase n=1 Tax=Clostridium perfringens TaxID=1502 RepID=UPI001CCB4CF3|nr:sugar isomerase [Clostridium perfringens]UBL04248.1 sugar isomerase [Clostridium perfringens]